MKEKQRVPYDKNQLHVLEYAIKIHYNCRDYNLQIWLTLPSLFYGGTVMAVIVW